MHQNVRFVRIFIHCSTMFTTILIALFSTSGYYMEEVTKLFVQQDNAYQEMLLLIIYIGWILIHIIWAWLTCVINLTSFGQHFLLCRAIHIRFEEIKDDLEYAILSKQAIFNRPDYLSILIIKHYFVCDMVNQANKHLKIYLFIFYIISVPSVCFILYRIIFSTYFTAQVIL